MGQLATTFNTLLEKHGFRTNLIRLVNGSPDLRVEVLVMRRFADEQKLIHETSQNRAWYTIRKKELDQAVFPGPPRKGDRILDDGVYYTIYSSEPLRDGPNVIGYKTKATGD